MTIQDQLRLQELAAKVPELEHRLAVLESLAMTPGPSRDAHQREQTPALEARLAKLEEAVAHASGEWEGRRARIAEYQRERRAKLKAQRNG